MSKSNVNEAALDAIQEQAPGLRDPQVRTVVADFLGGSLVFATAKEGRNRVERIVFVGDDQTQVFASCEEMARAFSGDRSEAAADPAANGAAKQFRLLEQLGGHLRRLKDWQLL